MPELSLRKVLISGGLLAASIGVWFLCRSNRIPGLVVPTSCFFTFLGLFGMMAGAGAGDGQNDQPNDAGYEERMELFYRLRPLLIAEINEQSRAMRDYLFEKRRNDELDDMRLEIRALGRRIERMQPIWQAMTLREDRVPMLRSRSLDTFIFNYVRPARQVSLDAVARSFSSSDVQSSTTSRWS